MRAWKVGWAASVLALGCSTGGTQASPVEGGIDATSSGEASSDAAPLEAGDATDDAPLPPCTPLVASQVAPSQDCIFAGPCPQDCTLGTASAYACATVPPIGDASPSPEYPSVFQAPIGIVNVVASETAAYPWDAGAFVSCGPLSCVRWATADHVGGTSAWPGDPCADGGAAIEAWSCPVSAGVTPAPAGCFSTGALGAIGGAGTGVPLQNVWCCPGAGQDAGPSAGDAATPDSGVADSGLAKAGPGDATPDVVSE
jgi:hypothetical protein